MPREVEHQVADGVVEDLFEERFTFSENTFFLADRRRIEVKILVGFVCDDAFL